MAKSKTICFDYMKVCIQRYNKEEDKLIEEVANLSNCFERVSNISPVDRTYNNGNEKIRIQVLKKTEQIWQIQVLRLRDEIMPGIADDEGNYSIEILEDGKYYGESISLLYDSENSVLVMQRNRYGLQPSNVEVLFNKIKSDNDITIILKPIINKDKIKLLDKKGVFKSLEIEVANDAEPNIIEKKPGGILSTLNTFRKYNGNIVTVRIGYDKKSKRAECLDSELVLGTINELYGDVNTKRLRTSIIYDEDTRLEKIDLLDDRVTDKETLEYNRENPITHQRVFDLLKMLYQKKKNNMKM